MNKKHTQPDIKLLISSFVEGSTSLDEERILYEYFSSENVAPEFEEYRSMFVWFDSLGRMPSVASKRRKRPARLSGIAAAVATFIVVGLGFFLYTHRPLPKEYLAYEGSYIIRDGKKITDLRTVVPEILRVEKLVEERAMKADSILLEADRRCDEVIRQAYEAIDPAARPFLPTL